MSVESMCKECIHNRYCAAAYKKENWCGNHMTKSTYDYYTRQERVYRGNEDR